MLDCCAVWSIAVLCASFTSGSISVQLQHQPKTRTKAALTHETASSPKASAGQSVLPARHADTTAALHPAVGAAAAPPRHAHELADGGRRTAQVETRKRAVAAPSSRSCRLMKAAAAVQTSRSDFC